MIEPGTATVPGSSGLRAGFGPSTPASPISPRGEFSNPPGGTREYDGVARAAPFLVCGGRRRIRAVDTRVTNFPAGVRVRPGDTRDLPIPVPQRRYALLVLKARRRCPNALPFSADSAMPALFARVRSVN